MGMEISSGQPNINLGGTFNAGPGPFASQPLPFPIAAGF